MKVEDVRMIGVCGAGTMGAGIAQQAAASGYQVRVLDVDDAAWMRGLGIITKGLDSLLAKEKITQADKDAILARLSYSTDAALLADVDYVIEAVFEDYRGQEATSSPAWRPSAGPRWSSRPTPRRSRSPRSPPLVSGPTGSWACTSSIRCPS